MQNDYIERLSGFFERLGGWSYDHRWTVLSICLLLVGASFFLASWTRYDNSFEAYFDRDDPAYNAYLHISYKVAVPVYRYGHRV